MQEVDLGGNKISFSSYKKNMNGSGTEISVCIFEVLNLIFFQFLAKIISQRKY